MFSQHRDHETRSRPPRVKGQFWHTVKRLFSVPTTQGGLLNSDVVVRVNRGASVLWVTKVRLGHVTCLSKDEMKTFVKLDK